MAYNDAQFAKSHDVLIEGLGSIRRFFATVARAIFVSSQSNRRMHMVQELQSKSDDELAALNIKRDDIIRHVFGDLFYS